ncbi:tetratricopeptide repeat protein [uncultured Roseivirga sp.]|uniref:tetratricopeptide repeat protein n=1 Tax=uncultured Roseivirga sp. TaxID=543088 RepID=UPI0030DD160D|tara:strand:+ start:39415 stop:40896 length:1482 start_codon:yes stop_codon:yes gene_type:complete
MFQNILKWVGVFVYPFLVLFLPHTAQSQTSDFDAIYKTTLDLDFKKSSSLLKQFPEVEIPFGHLYIANLNDVLELIFSENEDRYNLLKQNEDTRLDLISDSEDDSSYKDFVKGEIKLQWAFVKLKFGHTLSGVWSLRNAYKTVQDNIEKNPDFKLHYKTMGLLQVIFGAVPDNQQWILNVLGLEGDVQNGLAHLKSLSKESTPFSIEARLISSMIESYLLEEHNRALEGLNSNTSNHISMAEVYITSLILMKSHNAQAASQMLKEAIERPEPSPLLFEYLLAEALFQGGNYNEAKTHYLVYINRFEGRNQLKDSRMKVAMCEYFLGKNISFKNYWEEAKQTKGATSEADKNADAILEAKSFPNFRLLQIRYAIDGGYYKLASRTINKIDTGKLKFDEVHELTYRKARLAHLTNSYDQALMLYNEVISNTEALSDSYFAPNSYLQMGYIKMEENDNEQAKLYFNKVLEFRKHPYKNSLDSKAKIALAAIDALND